MSLLETQDLSFHKGKSQILNSISFSVDRGEIFALSGPSGGGKTSLLQLLCRMEEPSSGKIYLEGQPFHDLDPRILRRRIQWVFQTPVMVEKTVLAELTLGAAFEPTSSLPGTPDPIEVWMEKMHLSPALLQEDPKRLSVGEAQRIALTRAILVNPQVLLLDEPTSALDPISKAAIEEMLRACAKRGIAILLVTHDPRQISDLATRGLELSQGLIRHRW